MKATEIIHNYQALLPIKQQVQSNELLAAAREGRVHPQHLQRLVIGEFLTQQAEIPRYGSLIDRFRHEVPAGLFAFVATLFISQRRLLADAVAPAVGLNVDELRHSDLPKAVTQLNQAVSWVASHAGPAEAAMELHTDFQLFCPVAAELVSALRELDNVPDPLVAYLENYSAEPAELQQRLPEVVEYGLAQGEPERWVTRSAEEIPDLLSDYWHYIAAG
ncbi:hypothetical protein FHS29_006266 [Saccharothrix tamanrassetensis]|uniref:Uncharacterized protein n=1 Tax=Saccharothrix tamanrassetensis TaxID=1051531 RepID=A0A841CUM1_9PSEU|nr:hypothetical protein [Saccharothrix tamanrassetensis]MBB5959645.1 hypothetical protein [Saccharothrix tamanrassetensis]